MNYDEEKINSHKCYTITRNDLPDAVPYFWRL